MPDLNTIPDIPELPIHLKHDILNGKTIIFVGAGLSKLVGMPTWKELAEIRLKEVRKRKLIDYDMYLRLLTQRPLKILSICEDFLERKDWHKCLYSNYSSQKAKRISNLLSPFNSGFITTNYDKLLELVPIINASKFATKSTKPEPNTGVSHIKEETDFDIFLSEPKHKVYYLHGKDLSDANPPICTLKDYLRHYKKDGRGREILERLCGRKSLLFIGVGLEEFEILEHLHISQYENQHYALVPMYSYEGHILEQYQAYYRILNIEILPYNISQNGYEQLENVLKSWGKTLLEKKNPVTDVSKHLKNNILIDEVAHGLD